MQATQPIGSPDVNSQSRAPKRFREATLERTDLLAGESFAISAAIQRFERVIEGSGYLYGIWLNFVNTQAGNGAGVTASEDAPWDAFDTVILRDVNGELINLSGFNLFLSNLIVKQYAVRNVDQSGIGSVFSALVTGAGGTGGSFTFSIRVPVAINRRDLTGLLGNQDRAQKYFLRLDVAGNAAIYGTIPTGTSAAAITKLYENYAVPLPMAANGQPQEVYPPSFGVLHFMTATQSDSIPAGSSTLFHFLRRLGNTIRWMAFIWRINATRSTVETAANNPTSLRLKIGEDTLFNEVWAYRKALMFERFGFDLPSGVLVYDAIHDFGTDAGNEVGDDYYHTQAIVNAQLQVAYPAGFGSTNNSLQIITDDLQRVGAPVR